MSNRLDPKPIARRDFLSLTGLASAGVAIFGSLLGLTRLVKPRVTPDPSSRFRIGAPADFPQGSSKIVNDINVKVISSEKGFAAISLECTHLGCIVHETKTGYSCPCHGSKFDIKGNVLAGPAPRALRWFAISQAADGNLVVNTNKEVKANETYKV